jgi:hypothetical protein
MKNAMQTIGSRQAWWIVTSLALMVVGAFGPWSSVLDVETINGTDGGGDGWIVVGAAVVAVLALLVYVKLRKRWLLVGSLLAGLAGAATAAYDISNIQSVAIYGVGVADPQWGIYVALIGSVSLALAFLVLAIRRPASRMQESGEPVVESAP